MSSQSHGPIVVGIDGTEESSRVVEFGAREAARHRAPLHLLVAYESLQAWLPTDILVGGSSEHHWATDAGERTRKRITAEHPDLSVTVTTVDAHPAGALVAASASALLVVVGTHAGTGFLGRLGGSVAAQVAAHASAPVLVVRPGPESARQLAGLPVVVGLDGSEQSEQALAYAVDEAVTRGVELRAVYAWSMFGVFDMFDIGPFKPDFYPPEAQEKATRLVAEATAGWADRYPDLRVANRAVHVVEPVSALLHESRDAGLIVLGSRGRGGFLGLRLGSTVDGVIRQARCPVAVVHGAYSTPR